MDKVSNEASLFEEKTEDFIDKEESLNLDTFDNADDESDSNYSDAISIQSSNGNDTGDYIDSL